MSDPNEPAPPEGSSDVPAPPPPPPPPPADYGAPAPPPPPPSDPYGGAGSGGASGYGAPPENPYGQPAPGSYSPTDAIGYGWRQFTASPSTLLVPVLVVGICLIIVAAIIEIIVDGALLSSGSGFGARLVAAGIASALISLISQLLVAGLYKGGVAVADGRGFSLGALFEGWDKTQVVIAGVMIGLLTLVGTILCYFPALLVGFFTQFTLLFIVDKQMSAVDAIKASFRLCMDNLGNTILFYLLAIVVILVGTLVCFVGLLVAVPVVLVGIAYTYRRLQGEQVAAIAPRTA
jgi:uncharacterized membrane protein